MPHAARRRNSGINISWVGKQDHRFRRARGAEALTARHRPATFQKVIDTVFGELIDDPDTWRKVRTFILGHIKPYKAEFEFRTLAQHVAYCSAIELRALSGDLVKSFAELDIANFLFFNGIRFQYEKRYPHGSERYQPDSISRTMISGSNISVSTGMEILRPTSTVKNIIWEWKAGESVKRIGITKQGCLKLTAGKNQKAF